MFEITDVDVHYGGIHALRQVSLSVSKGEFVALIGANGAGKTTLLRTISGLKRTTRGSICLYGKPLESLSPEAVVHLGICHCPEGRHVWPHMTVRENLMLGAYARGKNSQALTPDLQRVFALFPVLKERQKQLAGTLSGGEQQMVAVGRALMGAPQLLLLDEPSLGLAPVLAQEIARAFQRINADGVSILMVEQNANMALHLSHRTYVLETGSVVKQGNSHELMDDPALRAAYLGGRGFRA